ncbi:uncharacterized protein LOC129920277 [Episyrphus balteatus]|uniref:uncharacterized protein LOC129920277 n=1 Tax=Episyrphus balteatus TaxID=286459 RepID=UPI002485B27A|nr:uncharacterized protein LOC129920277 [Episyrphus balteatus]
MEVLIAEVKKRSVLWDRNHCQYKYKDKRNTEFEWEAIARTIGISKDEAKKKWRNIRDQYNKEVKKIPKSKSGAPQDLAALYTGKWQHFKSLVFLNETPRINTDANSIVSDELTNSTETHNNVKVLKSEVISNPEISDNDQQRPSSMRS